MSSFEDEYREVQPVLQRWVSFLLLGKKIIVEEPENLVREGPNIIIGNHCGAFKDVASILRIVPRPVFFTANREIFRPEQFDALIAKHLRRHLKDFGPAMNMIVKPLKVALIRFVTSNIKKVGTIPVDFNSRTGEARRACQDYLEKGRAIIALQGRGRIYPRAPHPYVSPFRPGTAIIAHNLYRECGIAVPVTPLAMCGTQTLWLVPNQIRVKIGEPMFVTNYLGGKDEEIVERFREALERRVKSLFLDLVKAR